MQQRLLEWEESSVVSRFSLLFCCAASLATPRTLAPARRGHEKKERNPQKPHNPNGSFQFVTSFHVLRRALKTSHSFLRHLTSSASEQYTPLTGYQITKISKRRIFEASKSKVKFIGNFNIIVSPQQTRMDI